MNGKTAPPIGPVVGHHDLVKTAALLLMLVDHIGLFFFPDDVMWRVIGRASAPIWLFLVGYNMKSDLDWSLLVGAAVMAVTDYVLFGAWLPLNILLTIMLVRVTLPLFPLLMMPLRGFERGLMPGALLLGMSLAAYPAHMVWEYGSFAFMFAGWGWWQRQAEDANSPYAKARVAKVFYVAIMLLVYLLHYNMALQPTPVQQGVMVGSVVLIALWLARFHAGPVRWQPGGVMAQILHFCGRQTLLLYVLHFLLLGLVAKLGLLKELL